MYRIALFLTLCSSYASCDPHPLICKSLVDGAILDRLAQGFTENNQTNRGQQGRRGEPGLRGERGPPGPPGPPGIVKYDRIDDEIDRKIALALVSVRQRIKILMENKTSVMSSGRECEEGGLAHNGTCYTIHTSNPPQRMSYRQALEVCSRNGGSPAEIQDRNHQMIIRNYLYSKIPPNDDVIEIRIGMKYSPTRSKLRYRSGKEIPITDLQWWGDGNDYPLGGGSTIIYSILTSNGGREGIWNALGITNLNLALCERDL